MASQAPSADSVHVCLIGDEAGPNLAPALDPALRPQAALLVTGPATLEAAERLVSILRPRGVAATIWPVADAYDIEHLLRRMLELLEAHGEQPLVLNASGGSRPMALAAAEAFRAYDRPIFYIDPERDRLHWVHPSGTAPIELANRARLEPFLRGYGVEISSLLRDGIPRERRALTAWLVQEAPRLTRAIGALNWLARSASGSLESGPLDSGQRRDPDLSALIDRFAELDLLVRQGDRLRFTDEVSRFYANGGWLEEHVFALLFGMRAEWPIQDVARSVQLADGDGSVPNELDVAFLADNRLHLIECKTRNWRGPDGDGAGNEAVYRLETLADRFGGAHARAMLVTYRDLPEHVHDRARAYDIAVCAGHVLARLPEHLARWLRE